MKIQDDSIMQKQRRFVSLKQVLINASTLSICSIAQSYSLYIFNDALPTVKIMTGMIGPNESIYEGLLVASLYLGAIIGCIIATLMLKKVRSPRLVIKFVDLFLIIGIGLSCITNYWTILLGRIISGAVGGVNGVVLPKFIQEISPVEIYGLVGGFDKILYRSQKYFSFSLGTTFQALAGLGFQSSKSITVEDVNTNFWRFYVAFPALFIIIRQLMMCLVFKHDSPLYTLQINQESSTTEFIESIYKKEYQNEVMNEYKETLHLRSITKSGTYSSLFHHTNIRRSIVALVANTSLVMCGIIAISTYSTSIFEKVFSTNVAQLLTLGVCFLRIIFYSLGGVITQKYGRRIPLIIGTSILVFCNMSLGVASYIVDEKQYDHTQIQQIALISIVVLIFVFLMTCFSTLSLIVMVHTPELMSQKGMNMCIFFLNFVNAGNLISFPVIKKDFGIAYNFWLFGSVTFLCLIFFYYNIIDTQGLNEQQINEQFNKKNRNVKSLLSNIESDSDNSFLTNNSKVRTN